MSACFFARRRSAIHSSAHGGLFLMPRLIGLDRRLALAALTVVTTLTALAVVPAGVGAQTLPAGPRVFIDTRYVAPTGRTIAVAAGGDVQAALTTAQPGDVITLAAGA